ncbi:hypothetical protein QAD02_019769 [Eretmocerus hayati]|uniref:Uncharacterized protein n=1 Tax=Eretmocerus hayati TaxID=131215 RepID=A0ACC2PKU5_9HYME|nr:hypothetical protein QAD02_019769 [Eretmocerus hayati]
MLRRNIKERVTAFVFFLTIVQGHIIELRPKIVNGTTVSIKEVPFQVSLQQWGRHFCGGSILNHYYIITAAHCVNGKKPTMLKIIVGTENNRKADQVYVPQEIIAHKEYTPLLFYKNDIALIKLKSPLKYSNVVQPVTLPKPHAKIPAQSPAIVSGWGRLGGDSRSGSDILRKAQIWITDPINCIKAMSVRKVKIHPTQLCANDPTMRKGHCNGDSGGPLTVNGTLVGIVSWSVKDPFCASTKFPNVYTRVSEYIDWIKDNAE